VNYNKLFQFKNVTKVGLIGIGKTAVVGDALLQDCRYKILSMKKINESNHLTSEP